MSFSIFGKKKEDKKSSSSDQKSTKDRTATTADAAINTSTGSASTNAAESKIESPDSHSLNSDNTSNTVKTRAEPVEKTKTSPADTDYLLDANTDRLAHHVASIENISTLEEAAILFAGKQVETTELILHSLIQDENTTEPNTGAWLMLFDLYQVTNNHPKFEQLRSEYANKWIEITAPNWQTPQTHPTSDLASAGTSTKLLVPPIIEGNTQQLISSISDFAGKHPCVQLDCSQLTRIDFTSCGQLLSGLMPIATMPGVSIEFHDVNHLVSALLNAMGFKSIATIFPRQH